MKFFTGVPDTDRKILFDLSGKDVINACRIGKYAQSICNEKFWYKKIMIDFDVNLAKCGGFDPDIFYSDIYLSLSKKLSTNPEWDIFVATASVGYLPLMKGLVNEKNMGITENALIEAVVGSHIEIVNYLVNIYDFSIETRREAATHAARKCLVPVIELLDIDNYDEVTSVAAISGCLPIVQIFVNNKNKADKVFSNAIYSGNLELIEWLVSKGAHAQIDDLITAIRKKFKYIVLYLLKIGIDPNNRWFDTTPLIYAIRANNYDIVSILLEAGADTNTKDMLQKHPIYLAINVCSLELIRLLYKYGAVINEYSLILSLKKGYYDITEWLISKNKITEHSSVKYTLKLIKDAIRIENKKLLSLLFKFPNKQENMHQALAIVIRRNDFFLFEWLMSQEPDLISGFDFSAHYTANERINDILYKYGKCSAKCRGITRKGSPCKRKRTKGSEYCKNH